MSKVRVRFAPSPTGYLHIGGARTALFNFLFARRHQGTFVLRIEDTDTVRSTQESVDEILKAMRWLGLSWDEGPFYQSGRFPLYKEKVQQLLRQGKAYRCYCTPEELEQKREQAMAEGRKPKYDGTCRNLKESREEKPYVVRFRSPESGVTTFEDLIKGAISFHNDELDDIIIQRTDGTPTYNFVVVVDDVEMGITHVIRGDDHVNNTPRQIHMYEALGAALPAFAHVPMILGADKTRLSKRHGATSVMAYEEMGYLPEALVNYLVRLGWSHGDQEIFSLEELIEKFSLENVGRSAGVFNPEKLLWLNSHYIKNGDSRRLGGLLQRHLERMGLAVPRPEVLPDVVVLFRERDKTLEEMAKNAAFLFRDKPELDEAAAEKFLVAANRGLLEAIILHLERCDPFTHDALEDCIGRVMAETGLKMGKVAQPVRVAVTGGTVSPSVFAILPILGREETLKRLRAALAMIK
ncbi:MAG: glutamate--tRNA ligase [Deltaproteobacteria bacterium]|nr:glutamate--tRNA ligase [Deltaproteobacteria bacterium]